MADSSLWKTRLTDTSPRRTRPPAPFLLSQQAPARTARPLRELSGPGRLTESFRRRSGRGPFGREGDGRGGDGRAGPGSAWCPAPRLPVRRTSGRGRAEPSSCCFPRPRRPSPSRTAAGVPAPQPAMSRLLPLLRSRTARSLRPGPAAAPRPPSWCRRGRGLLALAAPGGPRGLGTHPKKEPMEALNTAQGARDFIYSLHSTERSCLLKELHRFESIAIAQGKGAAGGEPGPGARPSPPGALLPRAWAVRGGELCASPVSPGQVGQARRVPGGRGQRLAASSPAAEAQIANRSCFAFVWVCRAPPLPGPPVPEPGLRSRGRAARQVPPPKVQGGGEKLS